MYVKQILELFMLQNLTVSIFLLRKMRRRKKSTNKFTLLLGDRMFNEHKKMVFESPPVLTAVATHVVHVKQIS